MGILNDTLKPTLVQKCSRIKVHNALDLPTLLNGSENWTFIKMIKIIDTNRNEISPKNSRYTHFDHTKNEEIWEDLTVEPVDEK